MTHKKSGQKWWGNVKKASEYRAHAEECRALAKRMEQGEHREQLVAMAQTWERLAEQRDITSNYRDGSCGSGGGSSDYPESASGSDPIN
jgi:hypothetical protein